MTQDEYNQMLMTVQEIEGQVGFQILRPVVFRDGNGVITEHVWVDSDNYCVFRQLNPFTDQVEYEIYEDRYHRIVYSDYRK